MPDARKGHHGDVVYVFEDAGFDTEPNDDTPKIFGSNTILDTFEGSHEAVRVFNADRYAAEVIEQVFDGAWSVSCTLGEPPWWLAGVFGQPTSTETTTTGLYEHSYALGSDAVPLRLYTPTDGFNEYEVIPGAVIASVSVDQSNPNNPELSISGAYARDPYRDDALSISVPSFSTSTFSNRHAEVQVGGDTVGKAQNASVQLETGTEIIGEIGSGHGVDFTPGVFEPDVTHDKIVWVNQTVDLFNRFTSATSADVVLSYDNGASDVNEYGVDFTVSDSFPNSWSESGRNDPEAELMEELQEMGEQASATITVDEETPPGVTP